MNKSKTTTYKKGHEYPSNIFGFTNGHDVMLRKAYSKLYCMTILNWASKNSN